MKKILALLLAIMMILAMGAVAFATTADTPTGSIEITSPKTDPNAEKTTYEAYKIFDMTTNGTTNDAGDYTSVAYTINPDWADFFAAGAPGAAYLVDTPPTGVTLNSIAVNGATKYINITDSNVAAFAKAAFEYAQSKPIDATVSQQVNKGATSVKFEGLELGYYMIYPKGATINIDDYTSIVSLTNTAPNGKIAQKAEWPGVDKEADDISTEVGQTVTYTLKSKVPDTTGYTVYKFTFKDGTSNGLTYDGNDNVVVKIGDATLTAGTDYTFAGSPAAGNDFELTIDLLEEKADTDPVEYGPKYDYGDPITVTYTATVNENAVTKIDENHATLTYNNNPKDGKEVDTTPPVVVKTYSSKVVIEKVDGENKSTKLPGAKFVLRVKALGISTSDTHESDIAVGKYYKYTAASGENPASVSWVTVSKEDAASLAADTTITVVTTDNNGEANFDGLEDGTYELIEVEAPAGYNLVTEPIEVTIAGSDSDESKLTIKTSVENRSGAQLPSTGGIGTNVFYVGGSILVLAAVILLVTKRRMSAGE